ncbi:hypothetical protein M8818_003246 [Zalaria obscura]|uniref:Uncharacterized protein n=1 Tax=Zalaria obscura TaxID=2024903 RepID=A0ACC3SGF1_9PEZI
MGLGGGRSESAPIMNRRHYNDSSPKQPRPSVFVNAMRRLIVVVALLLRHASRDILRDMKLRPMHECFTLRTRTASSSGLPVPSAEDTSSSHSIRLVHTPRATLSRLEPGPGILKYRRSDSTISSSQEHFSMLRETPGNEQIAIGSLTGR